MKQIELNAVGQVLTCTNLDTLNIVGDTIGQYEAEVTLDEWWDDYTAIVQYTKHGVTYNEVVDSETHIAPVPNVVLAGSGSFAVHILGTNEEELRKTVNELMIPVAKSGYRSTDAVEDGPLVSAWRKILTDMLNGGGIGQILKKNSNEDYDASWATNKLYFEDIDVNDWVTYGRYSSYPYKADISLAGVTQDMIPHVYYSGEDAISGMYAPPPESYDGGVTIYSRTDGLVTIPIITLEVT